MRLYCIIDETFTFNEYTIKVLFPTKDTGSLEWTCAFQISHQTKRGLSTSIPTVKKTGESIVPGLVFYGVTQHYGWVTGMDDLQILSTEQQYIELETEGIFTAGDAK